MLHRIVGADRTSPTNGDPKKGAVAPSEKPIFGDANHVVAGDDQVIENAHVDQQR